jgi:Cell wall-active antibiotics response 4TMS YvqF
MRSIRSILGLTFGIFLLSGILSALGAVVAKRQLESSGSETDDEFDLVTIFDGVEFASTAGALRRASALTWYGGSTIDLRNASLDPAGATLNLRAIFGGLQLIVPESWRVERKMTSFMGGVDDTRDPDRVDPSGPVLTLEGWAVFGGIGINGEEPTPQTAALEPALA